MPLSIKYTDMNGQPAERIWNEGDFVPQSLVENAYQVVATGKERDTVKYLFKYGHSISIPWARTDQQSWFGDVCGTILAALKCPVTQP